jgi:BolA protein
LEKSLIATSLWGVRERETRIDILPAIALTAESMKDHGRRGPCDGRLRNSERRDVTLRATIEARLTEALKPQHLEVVNESHLHVGHHHVEGGHEATFDGSGETHLRIRIVSPAFAGKSRVERHRMVNALVAGEMKAGLHALAIEAAAPGEPTRR